MSAPLRVLLVEDSEDDAELLTFELMRNGFSPSAQRVETEPAMRAALANGRWDIVLSDYHLPQFSAERALAVLQQSGHDLPFIILSGVVQAETAVALLKSGAHDFLNKDSLARLGPAISRELREAHERRQRRQAEERVRILSLAIEQSPVAVAITDRDGRIEYVNPKFEAMTGYTANESIGQSLDFLRSDLMPGDLFRTLWAEVREGREWRGELCNRRRDGQLFWEYVTVAPLKDETGRSTHFVAIKEDITARRNFEERLLRQATYDELTDLPNRLLMLDRLEQGLALAHHQGVDTALLYIGLDRFKTVNDTLGHTAGDLLLKEAAARLRRCVRAGDTLSRIGGDEFVLVLPCVRSEQAARRAEQVITAFSKPFQIQGNDVFVTASIGITMSPVDGDEPQILLRNADLAMARAKETGRNRYYFFTPDINQRLQRRIGLESRLRSAVLREELLLYYQPIIDIPTGATIAIEALVRWGQPDGTITMPEQFIPVAEDVGLIHEIGEWVLMTAAGDLCQRFSALTPALRMAVNVSARQLQLPGFGRKVRDVLEKTCLAPDRLEIEITETVLMDDTHETVANLNMLCDLGVRLSIDDFGTGYSSLGYLQRYPFDTLKIDRTFIMNAIHNRNAARLVETIIAMAHGLELEVIGEGVETTEQLEFLRRHRCHLAQGYLFGRPAPVESVLHTIESSSAPRDP